MTLTPRQAEIYAYIRKRCREGIPPSIREIGDHFGIKSANGVTGHLKTLERKGFIVRDKHIDRGIRLTEKREAVLPYQGVVS